jgi:hypothetical protein
MRDEIGQTAGDIWRYLSTHGHASKNRLKNAIPENSDVVMMAIGWLAREGKLEFTQVRNSLRIGLVPGSEKTASDEYR